MLGLHDIADARLDIEEANEEPDSPPVEPSDRRGLSWQYAIVVALVALVTGLAYWGMTRSKTVPQPHSRFSINLPDDAPVDIRGFPSLALSPDGTKLVYVVQRTGFSQLYLRDVETFEVGPISGTEGGITPFFSPDGEWIGFFNLLAGKLEKVWIHGGAPVEVCETSFGRGASWGVDGTIVFDYVWGGSLYRVSASGGSPQIVTSPDREKGVKLYRFPEVLPDGDSVLFTIGSSTISSFDDATIAVASLRTGEPKTLIEGGSKPHYSPSGHIIYARAGSIMAVPFDLEGLEVTGDPVEVVDGVAIQDSSGSALFSFSKNGTLVYVPGGLDVESRRATFVDKTGDVQPIPLEPGAYEDVRVSPDGTWLALEVGGANNHIWLYELERETLTRLTYSWDHEKPRWTPNGHRVTFSSNQSGVPEIFWKPVDGSGPDEKIFSGENTLYPCSWSPDGKILAYREVHPSTRNDLWILPMGGERHTQPFLVTEGNAFGAEFSPDGRCVAYASDETGRFEVYVQPISGTGRRIQISTDGGDQPGWAPDGSEVYYRHEEKMMAVAVETGVDLVAGKPDMLFEIERDKSWPFRTYGISPDGRFVMIQPLHESTSKQIHVVLNWFDELKQLAPTN